MRRFKALFCVIAAVAFSIAPDAPVFAQDNGFQFVRIQFNQINSNSGGWGRGRGRSSDLVWRHDYPTAELNLYEALEHTTKVNIIRPYLILTLKDKRIFEYPILYFSEPGFWSLSDVEIKNLREFFIRGGFAIFDDFRDSGRSGGREWNTFYRAIKRVFPDRELEEIPPDDNIWHIYYDVDPVEAPSLVSGWQGNKYADRYYTMKDDSGRMMFLVCYNQDIGDGWEWPNRNIDQAATESFKMGINFIIYALTH
ncbi:DUF4159 domain-containing protein [candidate division KSB1 bacterium]